jgi:hypothetical protein
MVHVIFILKSKMACDCDEMSLLFWAAVTMASMPSR